MPRKPPSPLVPITLIVFIDVLGFTLVIPLMALYAERFGASRFTATTLVSVYAVCSLISTPIIGNLSDRFGRKPLLLISQLGTCAGFIVLACSNALWMVFLGRILDGITAGNLSTAQAYISDHTKPEERAKAFGIIGAAFGVGFMFGPFMAGELAEFGLHWPFIVAAGLSATSIIMTWTLLPRTAPPAAAVGAATGPGGRRPSAFDIKTYASYLRRPGLGAIYLQFVLFVFGFSCLTSGFPLFAEARFGWGVHECGLLFTYSGIVGIILQGGLIGRLVKKFGEVKLTMFGFGLAAVSYVILGAAQTLFVLLLTTALNGIGNGVLRPVLTSRLTQMVGRHEQGIALGISGSLSSMAMALAPPTGGAMLQNDSLVGWTLVQATAVALGLIVAIMTRASTRAASAEAAARNAAAAPPSDDLPKATVVSE